MILILVIWFTICESFDPSTIDYCKLKCRSNGVVSSGCAPDKCYKHKEKEEIGVEEIDKFRQQVVDTHNELRNNFAKGLDPNQYPKAANMHVVNYDLELEHIARCYILGGFESDHDKCRLTSYCQNEMGAGQNLYGSTAKETTMKQVDEAIRYWYLEIKDIPEAEREAEVKKFSIKSMNYQAGHFTQLVWGLVTRIGCVRVWHPTNKKNPFYQYILACNYAATDEFCPGNLLDNPIYEIGDPCTQCGNEQCNSATGGKYDGLCGESKPVSKDAPNTPDTDDKKEGAGNGEKSTNVSNGFVTILSVIVTNPIRYRL